MSKQLRQMGSKSGRFAKINEINFRGFLEYQVIFYVDFGNERVRHKGYITACLDTAIAKMHHYVVANQLPGTK